MIVSAQLTLNKIRFRSKVAYHTHYKRDENNVDNFTKIALVYPNDWICEEMILWCQENCKGQWRFDLENFWFENHIEATLFSLLEK